MSERYHSAAELKRRPRGVAAIVFRGDLVLLIASRKRRDARGNASVEIPAGRVQPGESDMQALARELREETGLEMVRASYADTKEFPAHDCAVFVVEATGEPVAGDDAERAWFGHMHEILLGEHAEDHRLVLTEWLNSKQLRREQ